MAPLFENSDMDIVNGHNSLLSNNELVRASVSVAPKTALKTRYNKQRILTNIASFQTVKVVEPFYTGGKVSQARDGTLATTLGEHVLITNSPHTAQTIRIPGVWPLCASNARTPNLSPPLVSSLLETL
jgi:hypothetical protein